MCDVERQINGRGGVEVGVVIRTLFHFVYAVVNACAGVYMAVHVQGYDPEDMDQTLRDLKVLTPYFFTNWNFLICHIILSSNTDAVCACVTTPPTAGIFRRLFLHGAYLLIGCVVYVRGLLINDEVYRYHSHDGELLHMVTTVHVCGTTWNCFFQVVFLIICLLYDVLEWLHHHDGAAGKKIKYWRDIIFCGMVVPFSLFVTGMFWTVYAIDRELVYPKVYDLVVPWWFNQCVHTNTTVMVILETLLQPRRKPTNAMLEQTLYWGVAFIYAVIYYTIYYTTNRWLYRIFGVFTWWQVCLYQVFIWTSAWVIYKLQFPVNRFIHGQDIVTDGDEKTNDKDTDNIKYNDKQNNDRTINEDNEHNVNDYIENNPEEEINQTKDRDRDLASTSWSLKFRNIKNQFEGTKL